MGELFRALHRFAKFPGSPSQSERQKERSSENYFRFGPVPVIPKVDLPALLPCRCGVYWLYISLALPGLFYICPQAIPMRFRIFPPSVIHHFCQTAGIALPGQLQEGKCDRASPRKRSKDQPKRQLALSSVRKTTPKFKSKKDKVENEDAEVALQSSSAQIFACQKCSKVCISRDRTLQPPTGVQEINHNLLKSSLARNQPSSYSSSLKTVQHLIPSFCSYIK